MTDIKHPKDQVDTEACVPSGDNNLENIVSIRNGSVIDSDDALLQAQGHEAAMPRSFSAMASLGLAFSITGSWVGYLASFGQNLKFGGPQNAVFALLIATFVQWTITLGLSEIASAFPSSGGQYHFVYILAPERTKRFAAFIVGWTTVLGWWIITCSGVTLASVSVLGLANFWNPDFVATQWQIYLMYLLMILITSSPVFLAHKSVPYITQWCLYLSVLGMTIVFIMILAMKQQVQPGSFITDSSYGSSGWNHSVAWVLGIGNAMYAYVGTDGAIHIAEEMKNPSRRVPAILNQTMLIGFLTAVPLIIAMMFTVEDLDAIISSSLPSITVFYQATGSRAAATFMQTWVTVIYIMSLTSQWVTSGRMAWALARDHGLPYSAFFSYIDKGRDTPIRATILAIGFCSLYGLLYLASTNAFNSIVTSAVLYLNVTYAVPQALLVVRGRHLLPRRPLNLGYLGLFCNIFSPFAVTVMVIILCFPVQLPVAVGDMNYSSVVLVGLFAVLIGMWFTRGHKFRGPHVDLGLMNRLREQR